MQPHFSPSMRSITISTNNGFIDLMKIKVAARHISYCTIFHKILILAFLLPFVFILTALVTLEGINKCSSFDCLGRHLGPRGRVDDSERLVRDFYKVLNQVTSEKIPDKLKLPRSFSQLVSAMKNKKYNSKEFVLILKGMMERSEKEIRESKFAELMNKHFAASAVIVSLCTLLMITLRMLTHADKLPSPELFPVLLDNSYPFGQLISPLRLVN